MSRTPGPSGDASDGAHEHAHEQEQEQEQPPTHAAIGVPLAELHAAALDAAANAIAISDTRGVITWVNPAFVRLTGYPSEEAIGQRFSLLKSGHHDDAFYADLWSTVTGGDVWHGEMVNRRKDGVIYVEEQTITPVRLSNGSISHFIAVKQDATARVRAEEALARSEASFRELFRDNPHPMWVYDSATLGFLAVNEAAVADYGYSEDEFLRMTLRDIRPPEDVSRLEAHLRARRGPFERSGQWRHQLADGTIVDVATSSHALEFQGRDAALVMAQDVTERLAAERHNGELTRKLQARVERLRALNRIDKTILGDIGSTRALEVILGEVTEVLDVDAAVIYRLDHAGQRLELVAAHGAAAAPRQLQVLPGSAAREHRPVLIADLRQASDSTRRHGSVSGMVGYCALPLVRGGRREGILTLHTRERLELNEDWRAFADSLAHQTAIALQHYDLIDGLKRANRELAEAYDRTIEGWARVLDLKDEETAGHSARVTSMTVALAARLGMSEAELVHVRRGALLHDIGKMAVPDRILLKPGPLDAEEWEVMRSHTELGRAILEPIEHLRPTIAIPYSHHEHWDGGGYPQGLKGEQIPLAARIFAVVDVFDALTSARPYRPAWTREQALQYLSEQQGRHFDPAVMAAFLTLIAELGGGGGGG